MVLENSPWETDSRCRYLPTFELCPVTLGFELDHGGTPNNSSSTRHLLRLLRYIMSKVPKLPGLGTSCPDFWENQSFQLMHLIQPPIRLYSFRDRSQSIQHAQMLWKAACSSSWELTRSCSREIPKLASAPKRLPLAAEGNLEKLRSLRRQLSCLGS